jgi:salicylate hydroxylase
MRIAVVGCGPGGLASALFLHRGGHEVTIFDQFDQPKPLGSGLLIQPSGQEVLRRLGLLERAVRLCAPVTRLSGINVGNGKRALDMEFRHLGQGVHALGIHRASLFDTLFDEVKSSAIRVVTGRRLVSAEVSEFAVTPVFDRGNVNESFDLLVDASGSHGPLVTGRSRQLPYAALWTTVDMPSGVEIAQSALDQRYVAARKMAGIMPVGMNPASGNPGAALFWSIKPSEIDAFRARGITEWRAEFLQVWPEAQGFTDQIASFDDFTLAIYSHRTGQPVSKGRIFHIGDSWHCTSPQLGQGANMALIDAAALSEAMENAGNFSEIQRKYRYLRSDHVKLYQLLSLVFTPLYQSDNALLPVIRDLIIHNSGRWPLVRSLIAKLVSGNFGNYGLR